MKEKPYKSVSEFCFRNDIVINNALTTSPTLIYEVPEGKMIEIEKYQVIGPTSPIYLSTPIEFDYYFYDGDTICEQYVNPRPFSSEGLIEQKLQFSDEIRIHFPNFTIEWGVMVVTVILVGKVYEIGYETKPSVMEEYLDRIDIGELHPDSKISIRSPEDTSIV